MKMKLNKRDIIITIIILFLGSIGSYSIYFYNKMEYSRLKLDSGWGNALYGIGGILAIFAIIYFIRCFFIGVKKILDNKFINTTKYFRIIFYIISLWVLIFGIFSLCTSQLGLQIFVSPILNSKIYFGSYDRVLCDIHQEILRVKEDKSLTEKEKELEIKELKKKYLLTIVDSNCETEYVLNMHKFRAKEGD